MVRVSNEKPREVTRSLIVLGVERLPCDFSENVVSELHMVICCSEHIQEISQYFRQVLIKLKVLNDVGVGGEDLTVVLDRNADDRLSRVSNLHLFHILLILEYMIRWLDQATVEQLPDRGRTWM